jgi:hypothetical protein
VSTVYSCRVVVHYLLIFSKYEVHFSFSVEEIMVARSMTRTENITGNSQGNKWARYLSQYNDWLRAGRSRDRIPVGARFSAPVQTGPGAHPASCTMGTGSFPGVESSQGVMLTPHPLLVQRSKNRKELYLFSP